jgi:hypothetical protein
LGPGGRWFEPTQLTAPMGRLGLRINSFGNTSDDFRTTGINFVMLATMVLVRQMLSGLLALALTLGTGWASCVTLEQQRQGTVAPTIGHMTPHLGHEHSIAHNHKLLGKSRVVSIEDTGQPESTDDACLKCCGVCVLTSILPHDPSWIVAPVVSRVSFAFISEQLRGRIVLVDPDIPKQIA